MWHTTNGVLKLEMKDQLAYIRIIQLATCSNTKIIFYKLYICFIIFFLRVGI